MRITPDLKPCKIMLVGEAPGKSEEMTGKPFVGTSGQELDRMLEDAGIVRKECSLTNVFLDRPPNNKIEAWYVPSKQRGVTAPIAKGKHIRPDLEWERERLYGEISECKPNIVIALGNTAAWALLDRTGINALRGIVCASPYVHAKVLPTIHPAAILRQYDQRAIAVVDLIKAKRESEYPEIRFPKIKLIIQPTKAEVFSYIDQLLKASMISYDIETRSQQITCIGFACKEFSLTVPFVAMEQPGRNYWSLSDEVEVWRYVKVLMESSIPKVTQNGLYDIQYLCKYNIFPRNSLDDTMLLHHSMQPEMKKSLGFLGSVYTNFPSWKGMRKTETNKKEE